ncbi:MAG: hypothetical protein ACQETB_11875 [Halobacteriota archaeon]
MALYDRLADLTLSIDAADRTSRRRETSSDFTRVTSTFALLGGDTFGAGEDTTYDAADHDSLADPLPFDFTGEYTFDAFSRSLEDLDLFPGGGPEHDSSIAARRWAIESAALDLALKQNDTDLATALDRTLSPVRFVASTRLPNGDTARVEEILDRNPTCEFKLDPTDEWDEATFSRLSALDAVRVLDLKGQYEGRDVAQNPDPDRYRAVFETFPNAIVEDPAVDPSVRALLERNADRLSWDAPIRGVGDLRELPFEPTWCNIKPSRFGTVRSLLETIEYCEEREISMYGGGQFELCVGRAHVQLLASLFYPDGPNDVAPRAYNEPQVRDELLSSPLEPPADPIGLKWRQLE